MNKASINQQCLQATGRLPYDIQGGRHDLVHVVIKTTDGNFKIANYRQSTDQLGNFDTWISKAGMKHYGRR